jgi:hypothetical protein
MTLSTSADDFTPRDGPARTRRVARSPRAGARPVSAPRAGAVAVSDDGESGAELSSALRVR